jgi:hypothetical protein
VATGRCPPLSILSSTPLGENADAVTLHYKAINEELEAQLAVALAQRDAWRELVEHCWRLVDAEPKRWFK